MPNFIDVIQSAFQMEEIRKRMSCDHCHVRLDWTLRFTDSGGIEFEEAFRADAFRLVFLFHCAILGSVTAVLGLGTFDATFGPIACCLFPVSLFEFFLRVQLHCHEYFKARPLRAQRVGAQAMLVLTTIAWAVYHYATRQAVGQPPASPLISALVPMMMATYPAMFGLFMLSPSQKLVASAISLLAVVSSPRWSSLKDRCALQRAAVSRRCSSLTWYRHT